MHRSLITVKQTKAVFMGITAHWIECNTETGIWSLRSEVIAFKGIAGAHTGHNLGRYFVSLCEHAGIIGNNHSKVGVLYSCMILYSCYLTAILHNG